VSAWALKKVPEEREEKRCGLCVVNRGSRFRVRPRGDGAVGGEEWGRRERPMRLNVRRKDEWRRVSVHTEDKGVIAEAREVTSPMKTGSVAGLESLKCTGGKN